MPQAIADPEELARSICPEFEAVNAQLRQSMRSVRNLSCAVSEDSSQLIDSPAACKLGQHRALLHSEDDGMLKKFRPFALPGKNWLRELKNV